MSVSAPPATRHGRADARAHPVQVAKLPEVRLAALATGLFIAGGVAHLLGAPTHVLWGLYLASYVAGGWWPARDGIRALRTGSLDVDLLMVAAAVGAASIGQVFDGALLIVIFATSGALEAAATARTAAAVRELTDLAPETATRVDAGSGTEVVPAEDLEVGDLVVVRPGDRVPADGSVVGGGSEVDQASVTGEPLPVDKEPGDEVFAGTVNGTGTLRVLVGRPARDSVVARIAALVAEASATKARTQLFIEKVEQRYSVGVVAATLVIFTVPLLAGAELQPTLLRAMTFMIVASPCALVLATMPPLLAAMANAGRHGVLVKSATVMENLGSTTLVAMDKTGTLTGGTPRVRVASPTAGLSRTELLTLAASAEHPSEHPLGRAVVRAATAAGIAPLPVTGFRAVPGRGVHADVGCRHVEISAPHDADHLDGHIADIERTGATAVVVRLDGDPVGALGFGDEIRHETTAAVGAIRRLCGTPPVLLTGDSPAAARHLAGVAGLTDVRTRLLPADKARAVRELQAGGHRVMMVGDGINDAPALAAADVGVAMGGIGSDLALQTADAVLVSDDLRAVAAVIELSRRARRVVRQNLVIAGTVIAALVTWDLVATLPLPLGVAGHEGSSILVALNGLRLLRGGAWRS